MYWRVIEKNGGKKQKRAFCMKGLIFCPCLSQSTIGSYIFILFFSDYLRLSPIWEWENSFITKTWLVFKRDEAAVELMWLATVEWISVYTLSRNCPEKAWTQHELWIVYLGLWVYLVFEFSDLLCAWRMAATSRDNSFLSFLISSFRQT